MKAQKIILTHMYACIECRLVVERAQGALFPFLKFWTILGGSVPLRTIIVSRLIV